MQHVYSHAEILGNECADHATALGAFGLVSNQTFPHVGRITLLIPLPALLSATTLVMFSGKMSDIRSEPDRPPSTKTGYCALFHAVPRFVPVPFGRK